MNKQITRSPCACTSLKILAYPKPKEDLCGGPVVGPLQHVTTHIICQAFPLKDTRGSNCSIEYQSEIELHWVSKGEEKFQSVVSCTVFDWSHLDILPMFQFALVKVINNSLI